MDVVGGGSCEKDLRLVAEIQMSGGITEGMIGNYCCV